MHDMFVAVRIPQARGVLHKIITHRHNGIALLDHHSRMIPHLQPNRIERQWIAVWNDSLAHERVDYRHVRLSGEPSYCIMCLSPDHPVADQEDRPTCLSQD